MPTSIRKFLLVNLLLAISITTTLTAIGNYYLDEKDIQEHLDIMMAVSALSYQALLGNDIHTRHLPEIQKKLNNVPKELKHYFENKVLEFQSPEHYLSKFNFQVINNKGEILLQSSSAPAIPLSTNETGFRDKMINHQRWRIFTASNPVSGIKTVLAERYDTRNELGQIITADDLYIMLLTFPLSGLLIWIIIGRGLDSLVRVAEEVSNRAPSHLKPVNIKEVPQEIKPVIDEINKLFHRVDEGLQREKRFAADAAHELRTPLAAIKAQAQVALNTQNLEEKDEALKKLIASVNRGTHVVEQLLTISKLVPEARSVTDLTKLDLVSITKETLAMLAPSAIEKHIELIFEPQKKVPRILGNATAISILIRNLVDNAIRYTNEEGFVKVRVYYSSEDVFLEVSDNGPGIPDELRARVFERFFRVLGNKSPGSGLGLGIVQQICQIHNAKVTLEAAEDNKGLLVTVAFPFHNPG